LTNGKSKGTMKYYKTKACFLYLAILIILALFVSFLTGCSHVKVLEYDDEDTYADMDKGFFAPPSSSDIEKALNILVTSGDDTDNVRWAVSVILSPIDNATTEIGDNNKAFSINEFVESFYKTLGEGKTVSKNTLKTVAILSLNVAIKEVSEHPEHRLEPIKAIFFALGERLVKNGITEISENMSDQKLLNSASYTIMSSVINHLIDVSLTDPIAKEIIKNQPIPVDLFEEQGFFSLGWNS